MIIAKGIPEFRNSKFYEKYKNWVALVILEGLNNFSVNINMDHEKRILLNLDNYTRVII